MTSSFDMIKREPLLPEKHYHEMQEFLESRLVSTKVEQILASSTTSEDDETQKMRLRWERASSSLRLLIGRYSSGEDVASLTPYAERTFEFFQKYKKEYGARFKLWERDAYQYILWLLSLASLLGLREYIPQIATWVSTDPDDGQDLLIRRLFARYHVDLPGQTLVHEKPYAYLLQATELQGEAQQRAVIDYLKHWYRGMKDCYWYDRHKRLHAFFFGYWAFEAGLVTLLYGIDDTPYRDLPYYPKDLVDFAKQRLLHPQEPTQPPHITRRTGELCPHAGIWNVLEWPDQQRYFREDERFPPALTRDRKEGPVTWFVMSRDDRGPTRVIDNTQA